MPDFDAISTAVAARFAAAQVTPPGGFTNIRLSTADLPNTMGMLPCVFVYPDNGRFDYSPSHRNGTYSFLVRFYYSQTNDLGRELPALRKWLTVLADQLRLAAKLGGLTAGTWEVAAARIDTWKMGVLDYASQPYSGIELMITVVVNEGWAAVA